MSSYVYETIVFIFHKIILLWTWISVICWCNSHLKCR